MSGELLTYPQRQRVRPCRPHMTLELIKALKVLNEGFTIGLYLASAGKKTLTLPITHELL